MLDNTQSIICAFGLASAAPRSPYRHLELFGIAFRQQSGKTHRFSGAVRQAQPADGKSEGLCPENAAQQGEKKV